jgi:hypothetical protein
MNENKTPQFVRHHSAKYEHPEVPETGMRIAHQHASTGAMKIGNIFAVGSSHFSVAWDDGTIGRYEFSAWGLEDAFKVLNEDTRQKRSALKPVNDTVDNYNVCTGVAPSFEFTDVDPGLLVAFFDKHEKGDQQAPLLVMPLTELVDRAIKAGVLRRAVTEARVNLHPFISSSSQKAKP